MSTTKLAVKIGKRLPPGYVVIITPAEDPTFEDDTIEFTKNGCESPYKIQVGHHYYIIWKYVYGESGMVLTKTNVHSCTMMWMTVSEIRKLL